MDVNVVGRAAALCSIAVLVGCGSPTVGEPVADSTTVADDLFDPCTIPDDAIAAAGLDPTTKNPNIGPEFKLSDYKVCDWRGATATPWFYAAISSGGSTTGDVRTRTDYQDFRDVEVNGRLGVEFRKVRRDPAEGCSIAFDTRSGLSVFNLETVITDRPRAETCSTLTEIVRRLETFIPSSL